MNRHGRPAVWMLLAILVITVGWWMAALWPLPAATPEWVARARAACFGSTDSGLPHAGGWLLLIGTPISMLLVLIVFSGRELRSGLRELAATRGGRWAMAGSTFILLLAVSAAGLRITAARSGYASELRASATAPFPRRTDLPAPPLELLDQHGEMVSIEDFRGRPVLVTFAYARCETVCPVIVGNALRASAELGPAAPAVLIVTLDPWRDTPARLPHIAREWGLEGEARILGGSVAEVEAALDAWKIERGRDPRSGEVFHPSLAYLVDAHGRIVYTLTGSADQIVEAVRGL